MQFLPAMTKLNCQTVFSVTWSFGNQYNETFIININAEKRCLIFLWKSWCIFFQDSFIFHLFYYYYFLKVWSYLFFKNKQTKKRIDSILNRIRLKEVCLRLGCIVRVKAKSKEQSVLVTLGYIFREVRLILQQRSDINTIQDWQPNSIPIELNITWHKKGFRRLSKSTFYISWKFYGFQNTTMLRQVNNWQSAF